MTDRQARKFVALIEELITAKFLQHNAKTEEYLEKHQQTIDTIKRQMIREIT